MVFLTGQGKQSHLTDSMPQDDNKKKAEWKKEDAQILSLLWKSMEPNVADLVTHLDTCKEVWEYLRQLYSSDLTRMYDVSVEYFQLQQSDKSVTEFLDC